MLLLLYAAPLETRTLACCRSRATNDLPGTLMISMHSNRGYLALFAALLLAAATNLNAQKVAVYQTTPDLTLALHKEHRLSFAAAGTSTVNITVDDDKKFQT